MSKIGIIGAMELEVATLKKNMDTDQITKKAGMEFHEGNLKGMPVVVVQCGVGSGYTVVSGEIGSYYKSMGWGSILTLGIVSGMIYTILKLLFVKISWLFT